MFVGGSGSQLMDAEPSCAALGGVATVDATPLPDGFAACDSDDLAHAIGQLAGIERAVRAQQLAAIAEFDTREAWRTDGQMDMVAWVMMTLAVSKPVARDLVRVAGTLRELPAIAAAFASGCLSWEQLVPLCKFATSVSDEYWAAEAPGYTPRELECLARSQDPPTAGDERNAHDWRGLSVRRDRRVKGLQRATVSLPDAEMAALLAAVDDHADRSFRAERDTFPIEVSATGAQRRADALVALTTASVPDDAETEPATVVVHAELQALSLHPELLGYRGAPRALATMRELDDGTPLAADTLRRLACDAHLVWVYEGGHHTIGIGRQHRRVPRWLRRRLRKRDGARCRFPGCERTLGLHAHHMQHWADHGCTDAPNLVLLCPYHHHLMHEGGWTATGDADHEVTFHSPDRTRCLTSRPTPMTRDTRRRLDELGFAPFR